MVRLVVTKDEKEIEYSGDFKNLVEAYQYYLQNYITEEGLAHVQKYHLEDTDDTYLIEVLFKHCFVNACILDEMFL